jgi:probable addiction module antidote protein
MRRLAPPLSRGARSERGLTQIAKEAALSRSSLYRALPPDSNLEFATVASVLRALGLGSLLLRKRVNGKEPAISHWQVRDS